MSLYSLTDGRNKERNKQRKTRCMAKAACPGTCRVQSCRAHVQGLKRPRAAVSVVSFYPCCRHAVSTSTSLGVHRPYASVVLPAVNDRTEGVLDRWRTCLERSSLWCYTSAHFGFRISQPKILPRHILLLGLHGKSRRRIFNTMQCRRFLSSIAGGTNEPTRWSIDIGYGAL